MPYFTRFTTGIITALCMSTFAVAAPPVEDNTEVLLEKLEDKMSEHQVELAKSTSRLKRKMEKVQDSAGESFGDDLEGIADVMEEVFAEEGVFREFATLFTEFAKEIDVDTDDGKTVLKFDGTEVAQIQHKSSRDSEDHMSISGLGKSLTFDRKTVVENGKSKTRIVIDMDGKDEIDITLPTP